MMWGPIHLGSIFLSVAVFLISLVLGGLYLYREHKIKSKSDRGEGFFRLPSLERLDQLHYRTLYIGFVFFTVGIITGGGWSKATRGVYLTEDPRQFFSIGLWIFYALLLNLRVPRGWIGRRGILLSVVGFVAVIGLMIGFL